MSEVTRKICLLGDFGVGKTSLVARYVRQTFSDKYLTTVGVKIDTRLLTLASGAACKLVIWDLAGADKPGPAFESYLRGAGGCLLVADLTRTQTVDSALRLRDEVTRINGRSLPQVALLNKSDLTEQCEFSTEALAKLHAEGWVNASAKTGDAVVQSFQQLAEKMESPAVVP